MATHNETGILGENWATDYLQQAGYTILARNYRYGRAEIDIIASTAEFIVFVEVKTRTSLAFGEPDVFVSPRKQQLMMNAAHHWLQEHPHQGEWRYDLFSIVLNKEHQVVWHKHLQDAFWL